MPIEVDAMTASLLYTVRYSEYRSWNAGSSCITRYKGSPISILVNNLVLNLGHISVG